MRRHQMARPEIAGTERCKFEPLEARTLLAAAPFATLSNGTLYVHGSPGNDSILLYIAPVPLAFPPDPNARDHVNVNVNGVTRSFLASRVHRIEIRAGAGNDSIALSDLNASQILGARAVDIPTTIFAGLGNDTLSGGDAHDVLFGGPGDDRMFGTSGHDRFVRGPGHDIVTNPPNKLASITGTLHRNPPDGLDSVYMSIFWQITADIPSQSTELDVSLVGDSIKGLDGRRASVTGYFATENVVERGVRLVFVVEELGIPVANVPGNVVDP